MVKYCLEQKRNSASWNSLKFTNNIIYENNHIYKTNRIMVNFLEFLNTINIAIKQSILQNYYGFGFIGLDDKWLVEIFGCLGLGNGRVFGVCLDDLDGNGIEEGTGGWGIDEDCFPGTAFWLVDNLRGVLGGLGRGSEVVTGCIGLGRGSEEVIGWEGLGIGVGVIGWEGLDWEEEVGDDGSVEVGTTGCIGFGGDKTEIEDFTGSTTGRGGGVAIDDGSDTAWSSGFVITGFIGCECIEFTTGGSTGTGGIDWLTITTLLIGVSDTSIGFDWVETTLFPSVLFCLFNTFFFDCGFVIGSWCFFLFNK